VLTKKKKTRDTKRTAGRPEGWGGDGCGAGVEGGSIPPLQATAAGATAARPPPPALPRRRAAAAPAGAGARVARSAPAHPPRVVPPLDEPAAAVRICPCPTAAVWGGRLGAITARGPQADQSSLVDEKNTTIGSFLAFFLGQAPRRPWHAPGRHGHSRSPPAARCGPHPRAGRLVRHGHCRVRDALPGRPMATSGQLPRPFGGAAAARSSASRTRPVPALPC